VVDGVKRELGLALVGATVKSEFQKFGEVLKSLAGDERRHQRHRVTRL
jgi:hypothetical protein